MQKEVELKAHIASNSVETLKKNLTSQFGKPVAEKKSDTYYKDEDGCDVRIREILDDFVFTKKDQSMDGGIEVNNEYEKVLTLEEKQEFEKTLAPFMKKAKIGYIWSTKIENFDVNIELVKVSGYYLNTPTLPIEEKNLGYFLETEFLIEYSENENITDRITLAKQLLEAFYKRYNLYESIERKKYMQLLH